MNDMITAGLDQPRLIVAGVPLLRPKPNVGGRYSFRHPTTNEKATVVREDVAAACEFLFGCAMLPVSGKALVARDTLRGFVQQADPAIYTKLFG